jgi:hypothetical protein
MTRLRDPRLRRLGTGLAGLALYLQLVFASWGMLAPAITGASTDALGGHALCLASASTDAQPAAPADNLPAAPAHDHLALCCLWHSLPGVAQHAAQAPVPFAYATIAHDETGATAFNSRPLRSPAEARAPPILA